MPLMVSKNIGKMADTPKMRVFCVTGVKPQSQSVQHSTVAPASSTTNLVGQSDSDSNTSGYLSSSSFESSGEEKRLVLNEHKVFQVWEKWGQQVQVPTQRNPIVKHSEVSVRPKYTTTKLKEDRISPRNSTPKQSEDASMYKKRVNINTDCGKNLLSIKKNLGDSENKFSEINVSKDSFWDIDTTNLYKSKSANELRQKCKERYTLVDKSHVKSDSCIGKSSAIKHDSGTAIEGVRALSYNRMKTARSNEWKRRPFSTLSNSEVDLRLCGDSSAKATTCSNFSEYYALPRYRVKVDENPEAAHTNLVTKLSQSCADFSEEGVPVDESMTEFLANVNQENLASLLNFYDKVTSGSAYEKARRNPSNYEAVYY